MNEAKNKEYEIKLELVITRNGEPFSSIVHTVHNATYENVVLHQDAVVGIADRLVEVGYANAISKGSNPEEANKAHKVVRG